MIIFANVKLIETAILKFIVGCLAPMLCYWMQNNGALGSQSTAYIEFAGLIIVFEFNRKNKPQSCFYFFSNILARQADSFQVPFNLWEEKNVRSNWS